MKRFFILVLLFLPISTAMNISVGYPDEILENKEFLVKISTNSTQIYDIKIDIFAKNKRISKIFDNKWKSTIYYVNDCLKNNQEYKLIISNYTGEANMIIKLRNSNGDIEIFDEYAINIKELPVEKKVIQQGRTKLIIRNKEEIKKYPIYQNVTKNEITKRETIILNPKTIKTNKNNFLIDEKYSKYLIVLFCFILFVLYKIKPKKSKNEFN